MGLYWWMIKGWEERMMDPGWLGKGEDDCPRIEGRVGLMLDVWGKGRINAQWLGSRVGESKIMMIKGWEEREDGCSMVVDGEVGWTIVREGKGPIPMLIVSKLALFCLESSILQLLGLFGNYLPQNLAPYQCSANCSLFANNSRIVCE